MTITIKEKITEALENYRDAAEPLELFRALGLNDKDQFAAAVQELEQEGVLVATKKGRLLSVKSAGLTPAQMISQSKGFSFARPLEGGEDIYVAQEDRKRAMLGDTVLLRDIRDSGKGLSGRVEKIIRKGNRLFTGTVVRRGRDLELELDGAFRYQVPVEKKGSLHGKNGDKVQAILSYGPRSGKLTARILKVYGKAASAKVCADAIIDANGIPKKFKKETLREAEKLSREPITPAERKKRADLREQLIFTIDGADAKDLDDAISVEKDGAGWKLGVHIADVSHYVKEGSLVDEEAKQRGTSVYFADRVIPMLPEALSNGCCSLNAGEEKLAFSCFMTLDRKGNLRGYRFQKSVICSKVRGVYDEVNQVLEGCAAERLKEKYQPVLASLQAGQELAQLLEAKGRRRGTMDFESSEARFFLDRNGTCVDILPRSRGLSEKMIEQFMILANQAAALYAKCLEIPFVYRVHEDPDPERLNTLQQLAAGLGLRARRIQEGVRSADLSDLLRQAEGTPAQNIINHQVLRTLAKARYDNKPLGHFGLNLDDYCHFTSPIRRYPDTAIHRILTGVAEGITVDRLQKKYQDFSREAAVLSSACELRAQRAERQAEKCYMAEYMRRHLGETFDGIVSGATARGIFVQLANSVEGFVGVEDFPDCEFQFDGLLTHTDVRSGRRLTVGDPMKVQVAAADVATGRIDFTPAE